MSIAEARAWITQHKRKYNALAMWDGALEDTRICAAEAKRYSGFEAANAYYNCRSGKKVTRQGLFVIGQNRL
jgi:hypothetical protein